MIDYDPRDWRTTTLTLRRGVHTIVPPVVLCVLWSAVIVALNVHVFPNKLGFPEKGHTLVGVALGLLLVFRTNASYDRFWEARKMWGAIVNETRNVARAARVQLAKDPELAERLIRWAATFPWATMHLLRREKGLGATASFVPPGLPAGDVRSTLEAPCPPLAVATRMSEQVALAATRGVVSDVVQMAIDQNMQQLVGYMGACQRIRNTPLPFAYVVHLRRALLCYGLTLPFVLIDLFGLATPLVVFLIVYTLLGIEEIGVEIEDPFGDDENDLPLEAICTATQAELDGMLAAIGRPSPAAPVLARDGIGCT